MEMFNVITKEGLTPNQFYLLYSMREGISPFHINLHQELLDTPEFFWEYPELEPIYKLTAHYLDRERRVNVLNQRLTVLKEMFDMLNDQYNHKQSAQLEWTIIWLIVIEVILALADVIFHFH